MKNVQDLLYTLQLASPALLLWVAGCLCLLLGNRKQGMLARLFPHLNQMLALIGLGSAGMFIVHCSCFFGWKVKHLSEFSPDNSLHVTTFGAFASLIAIIIGILLVLIGWDPEKRKDNAGAVPLSLSGEYFSMLLFSMSGLLLLAVSNNLIMLFLAVELVSVPTYIMVTLSRPQGQAREAGLKYFFLGAMAAGILVYGLSLLYGLSGSILLSAPWGTDVVSIGVMMLREPNAYYLVALLLIVLGLCFKIAALPLHFYVADVYQGAASSVTALLAFLPKLAGFLALMLVIQTIGFPLWEQLSSETAATVGAVTGWMIWILAAATMTVGNVLALLQKNVKRLLAYSSVAHTGYMMVALLNGTSKFATEGMNAILFYIAVYGVATLGAFGILALIEREGDEAQKLDDLKGLARRHPGLAAGMAICIFSLIGMPLTAGFIGKFYVFSSLVNATAVPHRIILLVIALVNAAAAAYYYLSILKACYLDDGEFTAQVRSEGTRPQATGIILASVLTLLLGVMPAILVNPLNGSGRVKQNASHAQSPPDCPNASDCIQPAPTVRERAKNADKEIDTQVKEADNNASALVSRDK